VRLLSWGCRAAEQVPARRQSGRPHPRMAQKRGRRLPFPRRGRLLRGVRGDHQRRATARSPGVSQGIGLNKAILDISHSSFSDTKSKNCQLRRDIVVQYEMSLDGSDALTNGTRLFLRCAAILAGSASRSGADWPPDTPPLCSRNPVLAGSMVAEARYRQSAHSEFMSFELVAQSRR
jgi:hypothetical protein